MKKLKQAEVDNLPRVTQLVNNGARIKTQALGPKTLALNHTN